MYHYYPKPKTFTHPNSDIIYSVEVGYLDEMNTRHPIVDVVYKNAGDGFKFNRYVAVRGMCNGTATQSETFTGPQRAIEWLIDTRRLEKEYRESYAKVYGEDIDDEDE